MVTNEVVGWLHGLAGEGCTFVEIIPGTKRTRKPWHAYRRETGAQGVASALEWLQRGSGVGILPKPPLWILDCDTPQEVERQVSTVLDAGIFPLVVDTPSGGAHLVMRLPVGFPQEGLKNHLCHPRDEDDHKLAIDFKFGPRTLLVAPGTVRNGKPYIPRSEWRTPPEVDPRLFLPFGKFWREQVLFLKDERPLKDRIARACSYLLTKAPASISKSGGHKTLMGVAAHLVQYLQLDPELAVSLMTHGPRPWNQRCRDAHGAPYPWSHAELWEACSHAVDLVPAAGRKAYIRAMEVERDRERLLRAVHMLKAHLTRSRADRVPVSQVKDFLEWGAGLPDLTPVALGDELARQGIERVRSTKKRLWCVPGLNLWTFQGAVLDSERVRQAQERGRAGCALMKQVDVLPPPHLGVERLVSTSSEAA